MSDDGLRILTDRLWPRGVTKERAALDFWYKEIAPSPEARKFFSHKAENFDEFAKLYTKELEGKTEILKKIKMFADKNPVTLLYAARDTHINHAVVLQKFILNMP